MAKIKTIKEISNQLFISEYLFKKIQDLILFKIRHSHHSTFNEIVNYIEDNFDMKSYYSDWIVAPILNYLIQRGRVRLFEFDDNHEITFTPND